MTDMIPNATFLAALTVALIYLFILINFVSKFIQFFSTLRINEPVYWQSIGNPDLWKRADQSIVLNMIIFPEKFSVEIFEKYKTAIHSVRIAGLMFLLSLLAFVLMALAAAF